ncbi:Ubiquinone biosynthesis O-methyltransferase [ANME-1 cluster archaeon GoMg3.2]|nr:Ubiquinone biosynthesis O-methyltransferase [ANME-1 cluster archaeon GoMg3.2]
MNNLKQFYEQDALREIPESTRRIEELRYRMLISKVPKESKKVLNVGCGNGELICILAEEGHECVAFDLSKNRLAKFMNMAKKLDVAQIQGDATNIPLQNLSIDVIMCSEVLEHIKDYEKVLKQMNRILKPHGRIVVSVPSKVSYEEELMEIGFYEG